MLTDYEMNDATANPDLLSEICPRGAEHPTPEQLLFRMAVDKSLTRDQRELWELYNYDRLSIVKISKRMKVSHQNISERIKLVESKIAKWCLAHTEVYETLKEACNGKR